MRAANYSSMNVFNPEQIREINNVIKLNFIQGNDVHDKDAIKTSDVKFVNYGKIQKHIQENKNVLISAHGNSLRALCKYLFKISDQKINELEIPTGNPLIVEFDNNLKIKEYYYLDEARTKNIIFNQ